MNDPELREKMQMSINIQHTEGEALGEDEPQEQAKSEKLSGERIEMVSTPIVCDPFIQEIGVGVFDVLES